MNLDDELRRLFADDRLEVPVRGDADATIVAGASRIRRRRRTVAAAGGAAAVAILVGGAVALAGAGGAHSQPPASPPVSPSTTAESAAPPVAQPTALPPVSPDVTSGSRSIVRNPTTTTTPKPPTRTMIGPDAYAGLRLGMTAEQAEATGLLVPNAQPVSSKGCKGYDYKGSPKQPNHYSVLISDTYGVVRIAGRPEAATAEGVAVGTAESELKRIYPTQAGSHGAIGEWVTAVPQNPNARYWILVRNQAVSEIRLELAVQDCYA